MTANGKPLLEAICKSISNTAPVPFSATGRRNVSAESLAFAKCADGGGFLVRPNHPHPNTTISQWRLRVRAADE